MVRALVGLFAKSPFKPLQVHMEKVMACIDLVPDLIGALVEGQEERVAEIRREITRTEHEADLVKNQLRDNLPRTLFLPVSRADLLQLIHHQDDIADGAEDAAILCGMKHLSVPPELKDDVVRFAELCVQSARSAEKLVSKLDELLETGFAGPDSDQVTRLIDQIGQQEWEADKGAFTLLKAFFRSEEVSSCSDIVLWMKLCEALGDIANAAEQVANHLRVMLAR